MILPLTFELLALPKAVAEARRMVEGDDLRLCVSELLTNVIRHVGEGTPVTVRVTASRTGRVRLGVTDPDPRTWPVLREVAEGAEEGRGLALVDAVAVRWGVEPGPCGKTVWCELAGGGRAPASAIVPVDAGRARVQVDPVPPGGAVGLVVP